VLAFHSIFNMDILFLMILLYIFITINFETLYFIIKFDIKICCSIFFVD